MGAIERTLAEHLHDPTTGWSLGTFGALAEFHRQADEAVRFHAHDDGLGVVTDAGSLRIRWHPQTRQIPYEGLSTLPTAWTQGVMVCLPDESAAMSALAAVTEIGPNTDGVIFDLGFGLDHVDIHVRSDDSSLIGALRGKIGTPFLELDAVTLEIIKSANPVRVFTSKLGSIEVAQAIPRTGGVSPMGPHTHILPDLLGRGRNHAANVPVPDGWVPALAFYPAHSVRDSLGELKEFDEDAFERFHALLRAHAPDAINAAKSSAWRALDKGTQPDVSLVPKDRAARTAFRVALRQWAHLNGATDLHHAWRELCDPTREVDEPDA